MTWYIWYPVLSESLISCEHQCIRSSWDGFALGCPISLNLAAPPTNNTNSNTPVSWLPTDPLWCKWWEISAASFPRLFVPTWLLLLILSLATFRMLWMCSQRGPFLILTGAGWASSPRFFGTFPLKLCKFFMLNLLFQIVVEGMQQSSLVD